MESTIRELETQLANAELNAEKSLQAEWIVGDKFKGSQKEMTKRCFDLVSSIRIRLEEARTREWEKPIPKREGLSIAQVRKILEDENVWEWEPWQVLSLPVNTLK